MKTRKPPRRISKKKQAQLDADGVRVFSTIARTLALRVEPAPKRSKMTTKREPKAKRDEKFAREFGSPERVAYIASLPCACGCSRTPCENHHIVNGGMGRKAHHTLIVPLAGECHREYHRIGRRSFEDKYRVSLATIAEQTAKAWYELDTGTSWHLTTP